MLIGILTKRPESYSIRRMVEAAHEREHETLVVDYDRCWVNIAAHRPQVMFDGDPLAKLDAVIPRIATANTFYGSAIVRQLEMMGVFTANSAIAIARARDKLRSFQILSSKGVGLPVTVFSNSTHDIDGLIDAVGGAPLVVKVIEGSQGMGVVLAETRKSAEAVIQAFRGLNANFVVQEYIAESAGSDIRCFIVDGKIVASMIRRAAEGEFRANIHRGGSGEKVKLTPEERQTAIRAAKAMNLKVAGVDLLRSNHGPVVLEINGSPGLEGIEKATGRDVAGKIIDFIVKNAPQGRKKDHIEA